MHRDRGDPKEGESSVEGSMSIERPGNVHAVLLTLHINRKKLLAFAGEQVLCQSVGNLFSEVFDVDVAGGKPSQPDV